MNEDTDTGITFEKLNDSERKKLCFLFGGVGDGK
jgi:hypothetical protein